MENEKQIVFDGFRLESANERLWRGSRAIPLRPKAFALLCYLAGRPGQLVTKEELLDTLWPETFVGEAVLKVTIRQLRETLGDDPKAPRYIETAHRRGYRFVGRIEGAEQTAGEPGAASSGVPTWAPSRSAGPALPVVGRDAPFSRLRAALGRMLGGERQVVFVTGEPGIGKTSLVDAFVAGAANAPDVLVGRGQCLEQYGTSEAYMPILEAVSRLCRERAEVAEVLRAHAPMWALQMPALVGAAERESLSRRVHGATPERMLREMCEALEALTATLALVLVLEDLHWSDHSTVDLISYLARQRHGAKLMLIGTYRPAEMIACGHPLQTVKRELVAKRQCEEVPLEYLDESAVAEYLNARFPANRFPTELARRVHDRTDGNPLFMVNAVDYLAAAGVIGGDEDGRELAVPIEHVEVGVPDSIRQMIEQQLDSLDADLRRTLEAASVAGAEFSTPAVVAALGEPRALVEARCAELARRRQFVEDRGAHELPNAELVTRYGFVHALFRNVVYERMPASARVRLHRQIAEEAEAVYGERAREIAAELAMHYECGASPKQAAKFTQKAADNALRRFAYRDSVELARRGLALLAKVPESRERAAQELCLQLTLGVPLIAIEGYAAPAVGDAYRRARELCRSLGEPPDLSEVLWGLWTFHTLRAELATARTIAGELLELSERNPLPALIVYGNWAAEIVAAHTGEFTRALECYERACAAYDPERHLEDGFFYALHPDVAIRSFAAWTFWFVGLPDQALARMREALAHARELSEPHGLAHALFSAALLFQLRREAKLALDYAEATLEVSHAHGLVLYASMATIVRGWALVDRGLGDEAAEEIRRGLAANRATCTEVLRPHFLGLLAEALDRAGRPDEGLEAVAEALDLARGSGEEAYVAELHRLEGELSLSRETGLRRARAAARGSAPVEPEPPETARAERSFRRSIEAARRQSALSLELRATTSLAVLLRDRGDRHEARRLLAEVLDRFTEGFGTHDLLTARALLDELS